MIGVKSDGFVVSRAIEAIRSRVRDLYAMNAQREIALNNRDVIAARVALTEAFFSGCAFD